MVRKMSPAAGVVGVRPRLNTALVRSAAREAWLLDERGAAGNDHLSVGRGSEPGHRVIFFLRSKKIARRSCVQSGSARRVKPQFRRRIDPRRLWLAERGLE